MLQPKTKSLTPKGGNDRVYTPQPLANKIVEYFSFRYPMSGNFLEPCLGQGAFKTAIETSLFPDRVLSLNWCEIDKGVDFLTRDFSSKVFRYDWIISNFPFSKYREFLKKSMAISENVITLSPVNHVLGMKARRRDIKEAGFFVREVCELDTPKEFPQSGFQWAAIYLSRNNGLCEFTNLDYSCRNFLPTKK